MKTIYVNGVKVIYNEGEYAGGDDEETLLRDWVETMVEDYYDVFEASKNKTIDLTVENDSGYFLIDNHPYEYVGGRLFRVDGDFEIINNILYKKC